jgi:isopenicillin-N N-acyltransferase-like protein
MARFPSNTPSEARSLASAARVLVTLVLTLGVLFSIVYYGFLGYTAVHGVPVDLEPSTLVVDDTGRGVDYGRSHITRRGRLWQLHLEGSPAEMGDAHGRLAGRLYGEIDARIDLLLTQRYGDGLEAWAERMRLRWDYRDDEDALREEDRLELSALAAALPSSVAGGDGYFRLFLQQCVFDVTSRLDDAIVDGVMFAVASRPTTRNPEPGNLVVGRSFSIDLGADYEVERIVTFHYPDGKYPFVSIGWAGLVGVVSGVNARGIVVAVNPARSDDPREEGLSLPILVRRVLEEADTLEQAISMVQAAELRSPGILLVGDGVQRKAVIIEAGPRARDQERVVRGLDEAMVYATNHMTREPFDNDAQNDRIRRLTSSGYRHDRLGELLKDTTSFTPERALAVLRDRKGLDGVPLGLGNRNALESLGSSHVVVIDATSMVLWVGEGPSALGRFRAFDLRFLLARQGARPAPPDDFPADRLLFSEEYNDWIEAREEYEWARQLLTRGEADAALASARVALALAPDVGEIHRLVGDIERERGNVEEARHHYRRYLELVPGRIRDQEVVRGLLDELGG